MFDIFLRGRFLNILLVLLFIITVCSTSAGLFSFYGYINMSPEGNLQENLQIIFLYSLITALSVCLSFLPLLFLVVNRLIRPMKELMNGMNRIAQGESFITTHTKSYLEMDVLAESFNNMSFSMAHKYRQLIKKIAQLEEEKKKIKQVQKSLVEANIYLEEIAMQDHLTGAFNRRYLLQQLHRHAELANRYKQTLSILFVDIDLFKQINDIYGHQAGDEVLKEFVRIVEQTIRSTDILTRYGGEEFIVLAPQTDLQSATAIAERIRQTVSNCNFKTNKGIVSITVSVGVATYDGSMQLNTKTVVNRLLALADRRCYEAKIRGRNQVVTVNLEEDEKNI